MNRAASLAPRAVPLTQCRAAVSLAPRLSPRLFLGDIKRLNRTRASNSGTQWTRPQMFSIKERCNYGTVERLACKLSHKQHSSKCIPNSLTTTGTTAHNLRGNTPFCAAAYATTSNDAFCGTCALEGTARFWKCFRGNFMKKVSNEE